MIGDTIGTIIEHTLLTLRFTPEDNIVGNIFWSTINSALRLGCLYATIYVGVSAYRYAWGA